MSFSARSCSSDSLCLTSTVLRPLRPLRTHSHHSLRPQRRALSSTPSRHATLLKRPRRPYTFTQLVMLSDGSSAMQRTTSPQPLYASTRDARNSPLWNPSSAALRSVEEDEAGRLAAFRRRFGRVFDAAAAAANTNAPAKESVVDASAVDVEGVGKPGAQVATAPGARALESVESQRVRGALDANADAREVPATAPHDANEEDDADNLMDLISQYGSAQQQSQSQQQQSAQVVSQDGGKKGGKKKR